MIAVSTQCSAAGLRSGSMPVASTPFHSPVFLSATTSGINLARCDDGSHTRPNPPSAEIVLPMRTGWVVSREIQAGSLVTNPGRRRVWSCLSHLLLRGHLWAGFVLCPETRLHEKSVVDP